MKDNQNSSISSQSVIFLGNENIRPSTDGDELEDLYYDLCGDGEGDVYLMDGCWLTPSGEIVER